MIQLPGGVVAGRAVWQGRDLSNSTVWIHSLSDRERQGLRAELERVRQSDLQAIDRSDFTAPASIESIREELFNGRGFAVLRGLDIDGLSTEDAARLFWGIGLHFGKPLPQNAKGHLLGHVKDLGLSADDPSVRLYQTNERQHYHTDSCDIVALICLQKARRGGLSSLASSWTAYNEMFTRDADLAAALFEPIWTDHRGEHPPGSNPWFSIPIFSWHRGKLIAMYQRRYIESAQRFPGVPRLGDRQKRAMDLLDQVLEEIGFHMAFEPGDIQFVHNHQILHDRTAFDDDPQRPRHLLRLWLCPERGWELPPVFAERYGSVTPGDRGGIQNPGLPLALSDQP
jgi:TfdA family taurine catabolism dioxygenase TauD